MLNTFINKNSNIKNKSKYSFKRYIILVQLIKIHKGTKIVLKIMKKRESPSTPNT